MHDSSLLQHELALETARVCQSYALVPALHRRVIWELWHSPNDPSARFALTLDLGPIARDADTDAAQCRDALDAIATLLSLSQRLRAFPALKTQLWTHVLESESMVETDDADIVLDQWRWVLHDARFPVFVIEMAAETVTPARMDALVSLFAAHTSDPRDATSSNTSTRAAVAVSIRLRISRRRRALSLSSLERIETVLDRVCTKRSGHLYALQQLDLSDHTLAPEHREIVDCILAKTRDGVYDTLHDVRFSSTALALETISTAVCTLDALARRARRLGGLRSLRLDLSALDCPQLTGLGAALRYASSLQSLTLDGTLNKTLSATDRAQCWRWLAFGVFYPQSSTLTQLNVLETIRLVNCDAAPDFVAAIASVLADPVDALVHGDSASDAAKPRAVASREVLVCRVQCGAQCFQSPASDSAIVRVIDATQTLEALVQQADWTCVVLPSAGLGWVQNRHITTTRREALGWSSLHRSRRVELAVTGSWRSWRTPDTNTLSAFLSMLELVDARLCSLELANALGRDPSSNAVIAAAVRHCSQLARLDLSDNCLQDDTLEALVAALLRRPDRAQTLRFLDLSRNDFGDAGVCKLAQWLSGQSHDDSDDVCHCAPIPALRELRVIPFDNVMSARSFASLHHALRRNKTLELIHLPARSSADVDDLDPEETTERARIQTECQNEVLGSQLPLAQKLAFLSVVSRRLSSSDTTAVRVGCSNASRRALDSLQVATIFRFAADPVHRRIVWTRCR